MPVRETGDPLVAVGMELFRLHFHGARENIVRNAGQSAAARAVLPGTGHRGAMREGIACRADHHIVMHHHFDCFRVRISSVAGGDPDHTRRQEQAELFRRLHERMGNVDRSPVINQESRFIFLHADGFRQNRFRGIEHFLFHRSGEQVPGGNGIFRIRP